MSSFASDVYMKFQNETRDPIGINVIDRWFSWATDKATAYSFPDEPNFLINACLNNRFDTTSSATGRELLTKLADAAVRNLNSNWMPCLKGNPYFSEVDLQELHQSTEYEDALKVVSQMRQAYETSKLDFLSNTLHSKFQEWPYVYSGQISVNLCKAVNIILNSKYKKELQSISNINDANFMVTGQMKLHPPTDNEGAEVWHVDGDNSSLKILFYLDSHGLGTSDGAFTVAFPKDFLVALTPSQRVILARHDSIQEAWNQGLDWDWVNKAVRAMPWIQSKLEFNISDAFDIKVRALSGALFTGSSLLHKGGGNKTFFRPVFQGYVYPIRSTSK